MRCTPLRSFHLKPITRFCHASAHPHLASPSSLPQNPGDVALARGHPRGPQRRGLHLLRGLAKLSLGRLSAAAAGGGGDGVGGLSAALPLPLEPVGGVLGLMLLLLLLLLLLKVTLVVVVVVVGMMVDVMEMAAVWRPLMLLFEGGAVDGDEVGRRRRHRGRGGHRVGGVHPSADSLTDRLGRSSAVPQCRIRSLAPPRPTSRSLFTRNSAPSEERGNMPAAAALTPLARSLAPRVLSFSFSVYLFPARTLTTRHCAAASTHFGLTCHFFTLSLSSSLSCSCSSSSSLARTPSCYVLWEFGVPSSLAAIVSEIEWMDGIIDGLLNFQDCHSA